MATISGTDSVGQDQKQKVGFLIRSASDNLVAAAGGTKAAALLLTSGYNRVITVATTADSVKLPAVTADDIGLEVIVVNDGANALQAFGSNSDTIDGIATGTGVALSAAKRASFLLSTYSSGVGKWQSNMGAVAT